jgi:signal transduction histidine kinase
VKFSRPSALTVLTAALLILLPALAVLQYRWVGQVSEAERDRMERNVRVAAFQFRGAFDGEIIRAINGLRLDATTVRESAWYRYADRYASWLDTTDHPAIVANVFLVDQGDGALRLRRWNPASHEFDAAAWPARMESLRSRLEQERVAFASPDRGSRSPFPDNDSLVVMPLVNAPAGPGERRERTPPVFGFTLVQWDMGYIRTALLPTLDESHFRTDDDRYRVAVVDMDAPSTAIYQSDPHAPVDPDRADASEPLFGGFRDPFLNRQGPPDRGDRRGFAPFRNGNDGNARQQGGRGQGGLLDRPGQGLGQGRGRFGREFPRWALLVQHESGSLEAAVERVRRRNLAISFGVLLLLTFSVGVLTLSSQRAHRLARQQMEFVAGVSHELRTPVAVIRSAAENLSLGVVGSGDRVKQYGQAIETEARRLGDMVERVLQYAGIASDIGLASRVLVDPAEVIESASDAALHGADAAHVDRRIAGDLPMVLGDPAALRSAVENLITNAVKYGGADGWVGIRAERGGSRRHREVLITVEDHGAGIPSEELPHIFNPFYRGQNAIGRQVQGNGLGLALVQQIITAHGGRVTVSTRPGAGSAFTIHVPAQEPAEGLVNAASPAEGALHS